MTTTSTAAEALAQISSACGAGHLHSHQGVEEPVARAILGWIRTGRAPPSVGG